MVEVRAGGAASLLSGQWIKYLLQVASLVVLSRLLEPEDFGLVAMVTAVGGVATVIGDFGLSLAAIRATHLTRQQKSNLFWINSTLGIVLGLVVILVSPTLGAFYGDPRIVTIGYWMALTFALNGAAVQFKVEINRRAEFRNLAAIDVVSQFCGFIFSAGLALAGGGYWALMAQIIAIPAVGLVLAVLLAKWRPSWWQWSAGTRGYLGFGAMTSATQVMNYVANNIAAVAIGRSSGPDVVGYYNRAFQLAALPVQQIASPLTRLMLPYLSERADNRQAFAFAVGRVQTVLGFVLVAIISAIGGAAVPVVALLLGDGWGDSALFVQILAVGSVFQSLSYAYYWATLAAGRARLLFWVELPGRVVSIAAVLLLAPHSPHLAAAGASAGAIVIWILAVVVVPRHLGLDWRPALGSAIRILAVFGTAASAAGGTAYLLTHLPVAWALLSAACAWIVTVGLSMFFPPVRGDARAVIALLRGHRDIEGS